MATSNQEPVPKKLKKDNEPLKVACLGPLGTYSHQATTEFFGPNVQVVTCNEIADVFTALEQDHSIEHGLVPIENSSFGPVQETMIKLRTTKLCVRGMIRLKIGHALLSGVGRKSKRRREEEEERGTLGEEEAEDTPVERIYSHEQAIGQCQKYLSTHYPSAQIIQVTSTSKAALETQKDSNSLAICSLKCSEVYHLFVVDKDIQDAGEGNTTRFIVLSRPDTLLNERYPVKQQTQQNGQKPA